MRNHACGDHSGGFELCVVFVSPSTEKFHIVSKDHGRT